MENIKILVLNNDPNEIKYLGDLMAIVDSDTWEKFIIAWYGDLDKLTEFNWTVKNGKDAFPYSREWFVNVALPKLSKLEDVQISIAYDSSFKGNYLKLVNPNQISY